VQTALCGKQSCPSICVRVCHCPAGLARSHQLAAAYRNRRVMSKPRASPAVPLSPAYQAKVEAPSEPRTPLSRLRSKIMSRANYYHYRASCTRSQALRLSWAEQKQSPLPSRHNFGVLNLPLHGKLPKALPTHNEKFGRAPSSTPYHSRLNWRWGLALITLLVIFVATAVITAPPPEYKPVWSHGQFIWQEK